MSIKVKGRSINEEFVYCDTCNKQFVWLNVIPQPKVGVYVARCASCKKMKRRKIKKMPKQDQIYTQFRNE